jgi:tetratricopeptide (TPR) repeat protein
VHGGGALVASGKPKRTLAGARYEDQFLDRERSEVPVATRSDFVGRRRQLQGALQAFRAGEGVLVHGMGNGGKSSLAARIASRMTRHRTVVVFEHYDAATVLDRLIDAVPARDKDRYRTAWRDQVLDREGLLVDALEDLLTGPLHEHPTLLIIDDLERILADPMPSDAGGTPMQAAYRQTYLAVLNAFARANTDSRLLLTSRYRFTLPDARGRDAAAALRCVHVPPMTTLEQRKQWSAKMRELTEDQQRQIEANLVLRALQAAEGNPGLFSALAVPILHAESAAAEAALAAIEHFQVHGVAPEEIRERIERGVAQDAGNAMVAFFKRMAFAKYRAALSAQQAQLLSASCLFANRVAVPRLAVEAAGAAAGVADAAEALDRLLGLGLVDDYARVAEVAHVAVNPHARPLVALDSAQTPALASAAVAPFAAALKTDQDGEFMADSRVEELARLALLASPVNVVVLNNAVAVAARRKFRLEHEASHALETLLQPALARLDAEGGAVSSHFAGVLFDCADRLGNMQLRQRALAVMNTSDARGVQRGYELFRLAGDQARSHPQEAASLYAQAAEIFRAAGRDREMAVATGGVADILQARGQLDEALRIRQEVQLPVYERLGDVRSKAVTQGKIADILQARGQLDEALVLHEQRLAVFQQLRDIDGIAHTKYSMAAIRLQQPDSLSSNLQKIFTDLHESFSILCKLQRLDGVGHVGELLAQVLAMGGLRDQALQVLDLVETAFEKLGHAARLEGAKRLRAVIKEQGLGSATDGEVAAT